MSAISIAAQPNAYGATWEDLSRIRLQLAEASVSDTSCLADEIFWGAGLSYGLYRAKYAAYQDDRDSVAFEKLCCSAARGLDPILFT